MTIGWGVIGAGGIARRRTIPEGIKPAGNAKLNAVMDVAPGVAEDVAREFGCGQYYENVAGMLADDTVQAVYIAAPVHLHRQLLSEAVQAGKHVLVEKPLAQSVKEAERMAEQVEKAGVMATEGYMMKFHAMHEHARQRIADDKLGELVCIRGQLSCWFPPMENNWRQIPEQGGGGAIMDLATHIYDLIQFLAGEEICEVQAFTDTVVHDYPVEDSAVTIVRLPSGCQGIIESYFNVRDEACPRRLEIYGSAGAILADGTIGQGGGSMREMILAEAVGYDAEQKRAVEEGGFQTVQVPEVNMYQAEIEYLSDCIEKDTPPQMNTMAQGVKVMKTAAAAYKSAKSGKRIKL